MKLVLSKSIIVFGIWTLLSCGGPKKLIKEKPEMGISFVDASSLTAVIERAEQEQKLVFLDFYTTWCLPCKIMDEEVFSDPDLARYMDRHFVSYKVNAEEGNGKNLSFLYEVEGYPNLIFLDLKGRVLQRNQGSMPISSFRRMAESAIISQSTK